MTPSSAYYMCSEAECQERQSSGEISIFESHWPPPSATARRIVNPLFAMTKYRRSAAGTDARNRRSPRTLKQLECCLDTLEYVLCHQQQPPSSSNDQAPRFPKQALTATAAFVEDRIRAIQADMVVSQRPSADLQYRIAKCHIIILFLLGNIKNYEAKFGQQALSAALANYWGDCNRVSAEKDDEVLCFMALHQICHYYQAGEQDQSFLSEILGCFRRNVLRPRTVHNFPKFQWALGLVHMAVMGRPRSLLRQLVEVGGPTTGIQASASFAILCRCCIAPIADKLRFQTLEQCNNTYMKGEKVTSREMARLLFFDSPEQAGDFCQQMAGLTRNRDGDGDRIVFKVGPVRPSDTLGASRQDEFVFGDYYGNWNDERSKEQLSVWDDSDPTALPTHEEEHKVDASNAYSDACKDAEGVLVPPSKLLYRILWDLRL